MENLTGKSFGRLKVIELKEIKGKLTDWAKDLNINFNTLYQRIITNKWDTEKAFMKPIRRQKASHQSGGVEV